MLGTFAASCSKEEVVMSNTNSDAAPTWSQQQRGGGVVIGDDSGPSGPVGEGSTTVGGGPIININPIEGDITDPNNDPDGKKKKI